MRISGTELRPGDVIEGWYPNGRLQLFAGPHAFGLISGDCWISADCDEFGPSLCGSLDCDYEIRERNVSVTK
jgi:hypothetical protein